MLEVPLNENVSSSGYTKLDGNVELKNVTFGYSPLSDPLIKDFNMNITKGQSIAIVGASGCGKSTMSKLVSGLYKPWSGEILFDGKPLGEIPKSGISGGQKQRLMIARAIASKPKILMLDEATNALDNITQKKVSDAIDSLNCTRIVIAHRLSTIQHTDRIICLDGGKIVEEGTYDELITLNGKFAKLVERQRLNIEEN